VQFNKVEEATMNPSECRHSRRVKIMGYELTLRFPGGQLLSAWEPEVPWAKRHSVKWRRRFLQAYTKERDDFLIEVATMTGAPILTVDTADMSHSLNRPATRQ
jgi:hypothetical protein